MTSRLIPALAAGSILILSSLCAHAQEDRHRGPGGGANLFISPMGEPYRSGPGDPYPSAAWFRSANVAGDGKLTRAEFRKDAEAFFRKLDLNHDGVVDGFELTQYEKTIAPEILRAFQPAQGGQTSGGQGQRGGGHHHGGGRMGGGGMGGGGMGDHGGGRGGGKESSGAKPQASGGSKPEGAAWFSLLDIPEPVASADRKLDGKITLQEFLDVADSRFDLLDDPKRGYLTLDSLPETPVQQRRDDN